MTAAADREPSRIARRFADSTAFEAAVRAGFVARGLTVALIDGLAIALAFGAGSHGQAANQQDALSLTASAPLGSVVLIAIAVGLWAYALWKLFLAAFGAGPEGGGSKKLSDRVPNLAGGIVYAAFGVLTIRV